MAVVMKKPARSGSCRTPGKTGGAATTNKKLQVELATWKKKAEQEEAAKAAWKKKAEEEGADKEMWKACAELAAAKVELWKKKAAEEEERVKLWKQKTFDAKIDQNRLDISQEEGITVIRINADESQ